jgi:hypothetical protein
MLSLGNVQGWLSGRDLKPIDSIDRRGNRSVRDGACQTDPSSVQDNCNDSADSLSSIDVLKLEAQVLKLEQRLALGEAALSREEKARAALEKIVWNSRPQDRGSLRYIGQVQPKKQSEIMSISMLQEMKESLLVHSKLAMTKRIFQDQDKVAGLWSTCRAFCDILLILEHSQATPNKHLSCTGWRQ